MNENESLDMERQENGQITYANEVIATIVSVSTTEVQGISGIAGAGAISGILGKGKAPRGVKVDMAGGNVKVELSVTVDYGMPIQKVGRCVQENVRKSIESMTGLHVEKVDLHVVGVSFEKENQELQQGQKLALDFEDEHENAEPQSAVEFTDEESEAIEDAPVELVADESEAADEGEAPEETDEADAPEDEEETKESEEE